MLAFLFLWPIYGVGMWRHVEAVAKHCQAHKQTYLSAYNPMGSQNTVLRSELWVLQQEISRV